MTPRYTATYLSPLGPIVIESDGTSLTGLRFIDDVNAVSAGQSAAVQDVPVLTQTLRWLDDYFAGCQPHILPRLNPHGTAFQRRVWQALFSIPYGQTCTYVGIARLVGCRSPQAVGQALTRNPIALIIPCHRVIAAHGSLGGYAYGLHRKRQLLQLESFGLGVRHDY